MLKCRTVNQATYDRACKLAAELNADKTDPEGDGVATEVAAHPEGFKRGGTVVLVDDAGARVFYDETACEWVPYDDND